jgi:hypothetical protein
MALKYDYQSFVDRSMSVEITQGLEEILKELTEQMDSKKAIDNVTFKHADYGDDVTLYLRRYPEGYVVSMEDKDFVVET